MKINIYLKKIEPLIAIGILIFLIITSTLLYQEQKITKEISDNCGWGEDNYYCICEKSKASELKNIMRGDFNLSDVKLVG